MMSFGKRAFRRLSTFLRKKNQLEATHERICIRDKHTRLSFIFSGDHIFETKQFQQQITKIGFEQAKPKCCF